MRLRDITLAAVIAAFAFVGKSAHAQANVVENESASVYVDANLGSDSNPGTQGQPLKTIEAAASMALANNVKGVGTRVLVNPGVYRELVQIYPRSHQTNAAITIQAVQRGTAIIDGADLLTHWNPSSTPGVYTYAWRDPLSICAAPAGWPSGIQQIALHREMVFVNGAPLTQVLSSADLTAGTFYVDIAAQQLIIYPAAGTDMTSATVEAAMRPDTLDISGRTNTVIRGLTVRHGASCMNQKSLNIYGSNNILLDTVTADWNNWGGMGINTTTNVTVQNSIASYNGGVGFATFQDKGVAFENNEADYNNWRGAQGALYDWGMGGAKFFSTHSATVSSFRAFNNQAQGLWFDTDNKNISIGNATLVGNALSNLQVEANEGPITLQNSALCTGGMGVSLLTSSNVTISGNVFYGNGNAASYYRSQLMIAGRSGGRPVTDWETGQNYRVLSTGTKVQSNSFQDGGTGQQVFISYLNSDDWRQFAGSLNSNYNQWYDAAQVKAFYLPTGERVDMNGWKSATGQDSSSNWGATSSAGTRCAVPTPLTPDFSVFADNRSYGMSHGSVTLNVRIRSFGEVAPVTLSLGQLPSGVSSAVTGNGATGNAQIVLTASSKAVYQTIPVTIFARAGGTLHSATVSVAIKSSN